MSIDVTRRFESSLTLASWVPWRWPCSVQHQRLIPLGCPSGQSKLTDASSPHHQQNRGAVICDGPAVSSLTDIQCDTHSAATQIWTGFSLHTNLHGLVTGQMLLSPLALAWHTHKLTHIGTQTTSPLNDQFVLSAKMIHLWVCVRFSRRPISLSLCLLPLSLICSPCCCSSLSGVSHFGLDFKFIYRSFVLFM